MLRRALMVSALLTLVAPAVFAATLQRVDGPQLLETIRAQRPKPTVVNLWATWCPPCVKEFPQLVALHRRYEKKGLTVLLVSMDLEGEKSNVEKFLKQNNVDFPTYMRQGDDTAFITALETIRMPGSKSPAWVGSLPITFLFDAEGKLVRYWDGELDFSEFDKVVAPLLKTKEPAK